MAPAATVLKGYERPQLMILPNLAFVLGSPLRARHLVAELKGDLVPTLISGNHTLMVHTARAMSSTADICTFLVPVVPNKPVVTSNGSPLEVKIHSSVFAISCP
jgi:hypothetical protein